jgi:hypothetical protein
MTVSGSECMEPQGVRNVSKTVLRSEQMDSAAVVDRAAGWANEMVLREARGPGDLPNAMERLERRYGIPATTFWAFRYRRPKDVRGSILVRLYAAYQAERMRQLKALENDLAITAAIAGTDNATVAAVQAVLGAVQGKAE